MHYNVRLQPQKRMNVSCRRKLETVLITRRTGTGTQKKNVVNNSTGVVAVETVTTLKRNKHVNSVALNRSNQCHNHAHNGRKSLDEKIASWLRSRVDAKIDCDDTTTTPTMARAKNLLTPVVMAIATTLNHSMNVNGIAVMYKVKYFKIKTNN